MSVSLIDLQQMVFGHGASVPELWKTLKQSAVLNYNSITAIATVFSFTIIGRIKTPGCSNYRENVCAMQSDEHEIDFNREQEGETSSKNTNHTPEIEKKFVRSIYDAIAPHFNATRFAKWPRVASFLKSLPSGSIVFDAGCGNGKYLGLNPDCSFIGCDFSPPLVDLCAKRGQEVIVADVVNLPFRSGSTDAAISIAVLHHLSTEERRKKALFELIRVLREGGVAFVSVWAVEQEDSSLISKWIPLTDRYRDEWIGPMIVSPDSVIRSSSSCSSLKSIPETESCLHEEEVVENDIQQEYFVPWHLPYHRAEINGACSSDAIAKGLAKKNDKKRAVVYNRYYHVFSEGELQRLVFDMEKVKIVDEFYDKSNWCIILMKTS